MKTVTEPKREVPVVLEADVIVIGGGPAGIGAALSAARQHVKTVLIEQSGDVGGVSTTGLMSHWTGDTSGGIYEEILDRSARPGAPSRQTIDPEHLKTVYLEMLTEAGVILRTYSFASLPIMEGDTVKGVIIESKSGREAILGKVLIDCSGDGDMAAKAGVPYTKGRENDGKMQPATLMFKIAGVHEEEISFPLPGAFEENPDTPNGPIQDLARAHMIQPLGHVLLYRSTFPGVLTANMTNLPDVDGTNAEDLTRAHLICRKQMDEVVAFLREYVPGFEDCYAISSASFIGIRETRHLKGVKTLTEDDVLSARVFEDWAVTGAHFNFDVHNITGSGLDVTGVQKYFPQKRQYTIPYGCLVPEKVDGLLFAGRCISGTHMAHSSYRVMPICVNLGQAAGIAAALSVKHGVSPREVPVGKLQQLLLKNGMQEP
ncbi:MAG: FAD-dependent oxidoreductase [Lachnospiraceae bacterium]|nr:FAD-dependent oxidoreductase [Lachnospiraceae bacterium]